MKLTMLVVPKLRTELPCSDEAGRMDTSAKTIKDASADCTMEDVGVDFFDSKVVQMESLYITHRKAINTGFTSGFSRRTSWRRRKRRLILSL